MGAPIRLPLQTNPQHRRFGSKQHRRGFTLIEVIVDAVIVTAVLATLATSFIIALKTVDSGRVRTSAAALANEQMEYLRSLPYDSLSTQDGTILPQGNIPDTQTIARSSRTFVLTTRIIFVDDLFDGCAIPAGGGSYECTDGAISTTQDLVPVDYKRAYIEVSQNGTTIILSRLSSNIAAKAAETPSNTGMLLVKVFDANGLPVSGATVTVSNAEVQVNIVGQTNAQGYMFIANMLPDTQNGYHIVATKDGYSQDYTTPRTAQNPNQFQPDVDINVQQITIQTLAIDLLAQMDVTVKDETGDTLSGIAVTATSAKITQTNPDTPKNIYNENSNASGIAAFNDIEWDSYALTVPSNYYIVSTSPYQQVSVDPNSVLLVALTITTIADWPRIISVDPASGTIGAAVEVVISGDNFESDSTVALTKTGETNVVPIATDVNPNKKSITVTFDLTGVTTGNWNIVVTSDSKTVTQKDGFVVS